MNIELNVPARPLLMNYIYLRNKQVADFYRGMRKIYLIRSALLILTWSFLMPSFGLKGKKYLISTHRLIGLISKRDLKNVVLVGGVREFVMALRYRTGFINTSWLYLTSFFYGFISDNFHNMYARSFSRFVRSITKMESPALILTDSDALPYQRSICLASQQANAKVVCIQHGIFHSSFRGIDGSFSDLNLARDDKQLNLLLRSGISSSRLALLGSVMVPIAHFLRVSDNKERRVILVGEGWYSHDRAIHYLYSQTLIKLKKNLNQLGVRTYYRPHPSEHYAVWRHLKLSPFMLAKRSQGITSRDIYIGATSTLLVDAAMLGAQSIQLSDVIQIGASFEDYGVYRCRVDELPDKVAEILNSAALTGEGCMFSAPQKISFDKLFYFMKVVSENYD